VSITTNYVQPALLGGVVLGVLSALPIVSAGNVCCCMWVISGGMVAAYLLQQDLPTPITQGDGALVGLLAGVVGAFVYIVLSIPINILMAPVERMWSQRLLEMAGNMPAELRAMVERLGDRGGEPGFAVRVVRIVASFLFMLIVGSIFSTLGGLLGAVFFRKGLPPGDQVSPPG
jgi:hypothetical protein